MDFSKTKTTTLVKIWNNLEKGLDEVDKSLENGTFTTPGEKGEAPPSESGNVTLWFHKAISDELDKRGVAH